MGQDLARAAAPASVVWFTRAFLGLAALWLLAQAHRGSFLGAWRDAGTLPGNVCWLLIAWCLARLVVNWVVQGVRTRQLRHDALFLAACLLAAELLWRLLGGPDMRLAVFFAQPVMVVLGFGALHRRRLAG